MEKETREQKAQNQLDLLQKQVDQLQVKVYEEKKHKWYKNPSLILSIIALLSSLLLSLNSILEKRETAKKEEQSTTLGVIKASIAKLIDEEEKFLQISSNQNIDNVTRNNANLSFQSKSSYLIDQISSRINKENINQIEPNLLMNYGRFLYNLGHYEESAKAFRKVIELSKDSITKGVGFRSLANIYANPSYDKYNPAKSREFRKQDINIANNFAGERKSDYLSRSYELWAIDEYYFLKNVQYGNKLIDSAKAYTELFPELNSNKQLLLNRLNEIYNFYNDILVPSQISGEYSFFSSDGKSGIAFISANSYGFKIRVDYIRNNKLYGRLSGEGNMISLNTLKYDVQIETVDIFSKPNYNGGSLTLNTQKNKKLVGYLYEFGLEPVKFNLTKVKINNGANRPISTASKKSPTGQ